MELNFTKDPDQRIAAIVQIIPYRGTTISNLRVKLSKMDVSSYQSSIILARGKDASKQRVPEAIEHDFVETITDLRNRKPSVRMHISEVPAVRDTDTSAVNEIIVLCVKCMAVQ